MNRARIGAATTLAAAALLGLAACSSSGGSSNNTPATQAPSPTPTGAAQNVTITPSTGLKASQTVSVVGTGFTPGKTFGVTECADKGAATGAGDCNLRGIKTGTANPSGQVTVQFTAVKGPFGSNNITCSSSQPCIISVADAGSAAPTEVASGTITFG
jgi:Neocarzinostatin family